MDESSEFEVDTDKSRLRRGYNLDATKIERARPAAPLRATRGQLAYELSHLMGKLKERDPERFAALRSIRRPRTHLLFRIFEGAVESWEKGV